MGTPHRTSNTSQSDSLPKLDIKGKHLCLLHSTPLTGLPYPLMPPISARGVRMRVMGR